MQRAHQIDAVTEQKFWFRKHIVGEDYTLNPAKAKNWDFTEEDHKQFEDDDFVEMTILDILVGNQEIGNTGLMKIIQKYMEVKKFTKEDKAFYNTMLDFLVRRTKGEVKTGARFMRDLVLNHPEYQKDSIVSPSICYDLVKETTLLGIPAKWDESLLGEMPEFMEEYIKTS